jgi:hypothetical protein
MPKKTTKRPSAKQKQNQTRFKRLTEKAWELAHKDGKDGKPIRTIKNYFAVAKKTLK